jgi:hypothetical protein
MLSPNLQTVFSTYRGGYLASLQEREALFEISAMVGQKSLLR